MPSGSGPPRTGTNHVLPDYIHTKLSLSEWRDARASHEQAVDALIREHLERRSRHEKDPVNDFLFEYYRFRPSALRAWSPGFGVALERGEDVFSTALSSRTADGFVHLDAERFPLKHEPGTTFILEVLERTQGRAPLFGCAGLHEWAMVYKADSVRHENLPLRLSADDIASVVEDGPIMCTHYDAFRFFTPEARPLNRNTLKPEHMKSLEQPGCLHANMDLYRWAFKRAPWIDSGLILDTLRLAFDIRSVDMRASPYDVTVLGLEPILVETRTGRAEYASYQQDFHDRAAPLRAALVTAYRSLNTACVARPGVVS